MSAGAEAKIIELPQWRDRVRVFRDRREAGAVLAEMLTDLPSGEAGAGAPAGGASAGWIVLAVPAGGVPVGAEIARRLKLPLDVAVVSKLTPAWNSEVGYGAVAFDGTVLLNDALVPALGLSDRQVREGVEQTQAKVARRLATLRGGRPMPRLSGRKVILVDDGLASGFTLLTAVEALSKAGTDPIVLAVPTAHAESVRRVAAGVHAVYCPNVRGGWSFAVADAYRHWYDLEEAEAAGILAAFAAADGED